MKTQKILKKVALTVTGIASISSAALADVNVQLFNPAMNRSFTLTEDSAADTKAKSMFLGATYNYVNRPIVELTDDRKERLGDLLTSMSTLNITGGYHFNDVFFLGLDIPVNMVKVPGEAQEFALGDSRLMGKLRLNDRKATVTFALVPELYIPTGNADLYLSDGTVGAGAKVVAERAWGKLKVAANLGYRYTSDGRFRDINYGNRLSAGLGANLSLTRLWALNAEGKGTLVLPRNGKQNPGEFYTGVRYQPRNEIALAGGLAIGAINGVGSVDYRGIIGVQFLATPPEAPAPVKPVIVSAVQKPQPRVFWEPKQIRVTEEIKFHHNSAVLTDSGKRLLDEVAAVIKQNVDHFKSITVEGHTNRLGSHPYNMKLSQERAASVREYLASRGVDMNRLKVIGYGKTRPKMIAGLSKEAQLAADRRVEFKVEALSPMEVSAVKKRKEAELNKELNRASISVPAGSAAAPKAE
ncbi:MAG TPA: OmpA family protein [Oligoflexia bacterium]|nr:OmpA family protein [Oligoflexia bacterium]